MMVTKTKKKKVVRRGGITNTAIVRWVTEYLDLKSDEKATKARIKELNKNLKAVISEHGYTDDKGHQYFELPDEVAGVFRLKNERRVSQSLNHDEVEKVAKERGIWEDVTDVVRVINEDKLMKAVYQEEISEEEFKTFIVKSETFALIPERKS